MISLLHRDDAGASERCVPKDLIPVVLAAQTEAVPDVDSLTYPVTTTTIVSALPSGLRGSRRIDLTTRSAICRRWRAIATGMIASKALQRMDRRMRIVLGLVAVPWMIEVTTVKRRNVPPIVGGRARMMVPRDVREDEATALVQVAATITTSVTGSVTTAIIPAKAVRDNAQVVASKLSRPTISLRSIRMSRSGSINSSPMLVSARDARLMILLPPVQSL